MIDLPSGSPIPGSRYLRVYCAGCKEAMRTDKVEPTGNWCADCKPPIDRCLLQTIGGSAFFRDKHLTPRQRAKLHHTSN